MWIGIISAAFIAMGYILFGFDQIKKKQAVESVDETAVKDAETTIECDDTVEVATCVAEEKAE
jgi:hypothetical protein